MDTLAVIGTLDDTWQEKIRQCRPDLNVLFYTTAHDLAALPDPRITILAAGGGRATGLLLPLLPNLRWIQTWSAGVDGLIESLPDHVTLTTMKGLGQQTVAEHAMALLLSLTRILPNSATTERRCQVPLPSLAGLTQVIVGYGHIGQEIGRLSEAFGMKVMGVRNHPQPGQWALSDLTQLLPLADVVTLACPLTEATYRLMNAKSLSLLGPNAFLINIARAEVVDQEALLHVLKTRAIGGAGLDVTTPEPLPAGHPLLQLPNVVVTPHVAGNLPDYMQRAAAILIQNLENDFNGRPLLNPARRNDGY